jgi:hypothetical protein
MIWLALVAVLIRFTPQRSHVDHGPKGDLSTVIGCHIVVPRGREPTPWRAIIWRASDRPELDRHRRHVGVRRIIDVASPVAAIERRTVIAGQRQVASQPFGQSRIGDEVAAEGDEIGLARRDDCRGTLTRETARRDQCTAEFSPQMLGLRSEPGP